MKWLDPIWWKGLHKVIGLEIDERSEATLYRVLILQKKGNSIEVLHQQQLESFSELQNFLKAQKNLPIVISLRGGFILERLIENTSDYDLLETALGMEVENREDFQYTTFSAAQDKSLVAVVRRERINEISAQLKDFEARIIGYTYSQATHLSLLPSLKPEIFEENIKLQLDGQVYYLEKGLPVFESELEGGISYEINASGLAEAAEIPVAYLSLYASLISNWMQAQEEIRLLKAEKPLLAEYIQVNRLKMASGILAIVLLITGLSLVFWRRTVSQEKQQLEAAFMLNQPTFAKMDSLKAKVRTRLALRNTLQSKTLKPTQASYYCDRIALVTPPEIALNMLVLNPSEDDLKRYRLKEERYNIIIEGECASSGPISRFSGKLDRSKWVEEVKLLRSKYNYQKSIHEFVFLLKVADAE